MLKRMLPLVGLLLWAPQLSAQDPAARDTLDKSISWGIDRDSGKIAVDSYLLYFYDPINQVLVVNGAGYDYALTEAGAVEQSDGRWQMPDGLVLKPLIGEVEIYAGDEPDDLRATTQSLRSTTVSRVQLSDQVSAKATRTKWFKRCNRCQECPVGCFDRTLAQGGDYKTCGSGGFFTTCKERVQPGACNPLIEFTCAGCTGAVTQTLDLYVWGCAADC